MVKNGELFMLHGLYRQGLTIRAIAKRTGLDRKTVRKYLRRGLEAPGYGPRRPRASLLERYKAYLKDRWEPILNLSARRLLREVRGFGYAGGYTIMTDYLRTIHRPR